MLAAASAFAGASSHTTDSETGHVIKFSSENRVFTFRSERNAISVDGRILVCPATFKLDWANNKCMDVNGNNAWMHVENILPGYVVTGYEYRFTGSVGNRTIVVYLSPRR